MAALSYGGPSPIITHQVATSDRALLGD